MSWQTLGIFIKTNTHFDIKTFICHYIFNGALYTLYHWGIMPDQQLRQKHYLI